jgi:AraC-like DNA-binding protein
MSRTSFAQRFKSLVGMPPLEYLTRWRMTIARQALRREGANLATIAMSIGYESDTAFSLAFKRQFGGSPGRYRLLGRTERPRRISGDAPALSSQP